jgi:agmatine deiminase
MYFLPPEWAPQSGVMLTWPHRDTIWADKLDQIDTVFVNVAVEISERERLIICLSGKQRQHHIVNLLERADANLAHIEFFHLPSDDIWVRDHGPISVLHGDKPLLLDFIFNGWGNKYPADNDNNITRSLHDLGGFKHTPRHAVDMVLEGGAIEVDGQGTLLTTRSCLLAKTRNPDLTLSQIEEKLRRLLGIQKVLWLDHGALAGDDTDGHIDTLARFTDPHTLCYVSCDDPKDPHFGPLKNMENQLKTFTDVAGNPYRLIPLPWPEACYANEDGRRLPATYANFLIINDAVLVPTYDDPADQEALSQLGSCFPDRQVVGIRCLPVIQWYGSLHCMTMQLPKGILS